MQNTAARIAALEYVMLQTLATSYEAMGLTTVEVADIRKTMLRRAKASPSLDPQKQAVVVAVERMLETAGEMHRMMTESQRD